MESWKIVLIAVGSVFLVLDLALLLIYVLYKKSKKRSKLKRSKYEPLISVESNNPWTNIPLKNVQYTPDLEKPLEPYKPTPKDRIKTPGKTFFNTTKSSSDAYEHTSSRNKAKLMFELSYNFRTSEVQLSLKGGKNMPNYYNEQILVTIMLSSCPLVLTTVPIDGSEPIFNENFRLPLESSAISEDPPVRLKFNIWTVDRYSRKNPYGYVDVSVEDIFLEKGLNPEPGKGLVIKQIIRCSSLKDDHAAPEAYIHLTYLSSARRISVVLSQVKNLKLSEVIKEVQGKVLLKHRGVEKSSYLTSILPAKEELNFNEEFVFHLSDYNDVSLDRISILVELQYKSAKRFSKPLTIGRVIIGPTGERHGREHWASMMSSSSTTSKWHRVELI